MGSRCQSCGMPLKQDPKGGGREADGSVSGEYCSYCYQDGAFTQPEMTAQQMQAFCLGKLREGGWPRPVAWVVTRDIPKLRRWK